MDEKEIKKKKTRARTVAPCGKAEGAFFDAQEQLTNPKRTCDRDRGAGVVVIRVSRPSKKAVQSHEAVTGYDKKKKTNNIQHN
jgi:hypothetical protein